MINRHAFAAIIKKGKDEAFRQKLGQQWALITEFLDNNGMKNFSLWSCDEYVFGYYETQEADSLGDEAKESARALYAGFDDCLDWLSTPDKEMRLMYHCFGVVRENKELIRHRMFMTKLKPGCAEEYKARHDKLIESRNGAVVEGPDSNFSIWSDGNYIFGYDEIDTSMEKPETEEEHQATVEWETRQLGIMDWITNDCDWLTGQVHSASRRIAWHG